MLGFVCPRHDSPVFSLLPTSLRSWPLERAREESTSWNPLLRRYMCTSQPGAVHGCGSVIDSVCVLAYVGIMSVNRLWQDAECKASQCRAGRAGAVGHQLARRLVLNSAHCFLSCRLSRTWCFWLGYFISLT